MCASGLASLKVHLCACWWVYQRVCLGEYPSTQPGGACLIHPFRSTDVAVDMFTPWHLSLVHRTHARMHMRTDTRTRTCIRGDGDGGEDWKGCKIYRGHSQGEKQPGATRTHTHTHTVQCYFVTLFVCYNYGKDAKFCLRYCKNKWSHWLRKSEATTKEQLKPL